MAKKFFRIIWRVNALLICAGGILAVGLLGYVLLTTLDMPSTFGRTKVDLANSETEAGQNHKLTISQIDNLDGTVFVRATVQFQPLREEGSFSSSRYVSSTTCNFIFYDSTTNEVHTLFPANNSIVVQSDVFYFPSEPMRVAKWIDYIVADKDTDHDGIILDSDLKSFAISNPDGQGYHVYLTNLDRVLNTQLNGENDFFVYYEQNNSFFVTRIDLLQQKIIQTTKLF